jgi:hypothetical protein
LAASTNPQLLEEAQNKEQFSELLFFQPAKNHHKNTKKFKVTTSDLSKALNSQID